MARKKNYYLVVDTETANTIEQPLPYDIGWAICDRKGNIYERKSFIVAEIFLDMKDLMTSAYYAEKIPQYWEDIKQGKRKVATIWNIRKEMLSDMKKYKTKKVGAYNMGFDKRALNNLIRYVSKSFLRWWFPFNTEYFCIWNMACNAILNRKTYIDFATKNGFISTADNIQTSAECAYRYIKKNVDFLESHTGLEDVEIEVEIFAECIKQKKALKTEINSGCWRVVQKKRKELDVREAFKQAPAA